MHLDGDAFFVSVEVAKDPRLRGRPVVSGYERGIASAMSYEAKKLGITRGMPVFQIRRQFPQVIIVSSDYEMYAVFSRRMMDIIKRYTDAVEEYSIDECFADFSHDIEFIKNPLAVLERIKSDITRELGISVSLGLGPSKVIAKTASKRNKPNGLTIVLPEDVPGMLSTTPVDSVWGIGSATAFALRKKGVSTALELARKPLEWVEEHFSKPMVEMWHELNSISVMPVGASGEDQKSIMKTRTFVPASENKAFVFSELSKNAENACRKARKMALVACEFSLYIKTADFTYERAWCRFVSPTNNTFEVLREAGKLFDSIYKNKTRYRSSGVTLHGLIPEIEKQEDLFGASIAATKKNEVFKTIDKMNKKYGKPLIHVASSSRAILKEMSEDTVEPFMPKGFVKRLSVPYLGEVM